MANGSNDTNGSRCQERTHASTKPWFLGSSSLEIPSGLGWFRRNGIGRREVRPSGHDNTRHHSLFLTQLSDALSISILQFSLVRLENQTSTFDGLMSQSCITALLTCTQEEKQMMVLATKPDTTDVHP